MSGSGLKTLVIPLVNWFGFLNRREEFLFFWEHPESPEVESDVAGAAVDIFSDLDFTSTTIEASHGLGLFRNDCVVMRLEGTHNLQ